MDTIYAHIPLFNSGNQSIYEINFKERETSVPLFIQSWLGCKENLVFLVEALGKWKVEVNGKFICCLLNWAYSTVWG